MLFRSEELDRSRLPGLRLEHVRGHSGDPDNDRCDAIAVAFSRGRLPQLSVGERVASAQLEAERPAEAPCLAGSVPTTGEPGGDPAPAGLVRLLDRLELADRLARGGHGLTLVELAQLVEQPLRQLESRTAAWSWRDWHVLPLADGRWRLERGAGGLAEPE